MTTAIAFSFEHIKGDISDHYYGKRIQNDLID